MTEDIHARVSQYYLDLEQKIQMQFPKTKLAVFGSYGLNIALPCNVFDIYLKSELKMEKHAFLQEIRRIFANASFVQDCYITRMQIKVQLKPSHGGFKMEFSVYDHLIKDPIREPLAQSYFEAYEALRPLVILVKQVIYKHEHQFLYNMQIILMVVFYFQIQQTTMNKKLEDFKKENLADLFLGFLYFYGYEIDNFQSFVLCPCKHSEIPSSHNLFQNYYLSN
jgi:DNA polymerase sigma